MGPGDSGKGVAAERLALITSASFVRAELTALAWAHTGTTTDSLSEAIKGAADNRDKAEILERGLAGGAATSFKRSTDRWALERLRPQLADVTRGVQELQVEMRTVFARLYRHRNLIVHGGKTDAVGSESALRLAAPLVGAGLDRVAQALLERGCGPLELAARARARLEVLDCATTDRGSGVIDLLE